MPAFFWPSPSPSVSLVQTKALKHLFCPKRLFSEEGELVKHALTWFNDDALTRQAQDSPKALLHEFAHVQANHGILHAKVGFGEGFAQLRLANACHPTTSQPSHQKAGY